MIDLLFWAFIIGFAPLALDLAVWQVASVVRGLGSILREDEPDLDENWRFSPTFDFDRLHGDEARPRQGMSR